MLYYWRVCTPNFTDFKQLRSVSSNFADSFYEVKKAWKNSCFLFRRTLRVFHFFLFSILLVFIFTCFYFFLFSFLLVFISSRFRLLRWLIAFACFTVCVVTTSATNLREHFLLSGVFYLPAGFKAFLGASSSTSKLAGLHTDLRNIALARLFVWIAI